MSDKHTARWARVRQLQTLEQQLAILRPQVERDLRELIEELQDAGVSQRRIGEQINRSKTVIHHIAAGDRRELQSLSAWVATLLEYQETGPKKPKGKPRGRWGKIIQQKRKTEVTSEQNLASIHAATERFPTSAIAFR